MEDNYIIRFGQVLNVQDDKDGLRIKVRLKYEDADIKSDNDLPYCFPLLPRILHVNPKIGELVLIILQRQGQSYGNRFFIGPYHSQAYNIAQGNFYYDQCLFQGVQNLKPLPHPDTVASNEGTFPEREDIAIQGRDNSDVLLKPNQLLLRCGFKKNHMSGGVIQTFNDKDLAYIQLRYGDYKDNKNIPFNSVANIVADRINLLSHDSGTYFDLGDKKELITHETLMKILETAHPMVYGDRLIEFLKLFVNTFLNHDHKWAQIPPTPTENLTKLTTETNTLNNTILSKSIHFN